MDPDVKTILERARATATYAAGQAGKAAGAATKKAGDIAMLTKLNLQIFDLNTDIDAVYKEIGRIVYLVHAGEETQEAELDDKFAQIDEKLAKVAELKETINSSKATVTCPVCGKECGRDAFYCSQCGHKL